MQFDQAKYLPYNVHNNNQLYQPIDKSNFLAFYVHDLGCIVLKEGRKNGIANVAATDHFGIKELIARYILHVWIPNYPVIQKEMASRVVVVCCSAKQGSNQGSTTCICKRI